MKKLIEYLKSLKVKVSTKSKTIVINNLEIEVLKKDIKNIHLSVHPPEGNIKISAPHKYDDEKIRLFAVSKLPWIKKHLAQIDDQNRQSTRENVSGESHYFKGRRYLLNVIYRNTPPDIIIRNKKHIDLYCRPGTTQDQKNKILQEWYRKELKLAIPPIIEKWQKITGICINGWGVKFMKKKWGTCNQEKGTILINLELIKKPEIHLEYVILHEMIHMLERTHNAVFVAYMDQYMPKWATYRKELNDFIL